MTVIRPAPVRKSIVVKASTEKSFTTFTSRIGRWWPRSKSIGSAPQADVVLEPGVGGRWYERGSDGSECQWGKVLQWEPPGRLVLAWQINGSWSFDPTLVTEVEVRFVAETPNRTRVELEHRDLERFGDGQEPIRAAFDSPGGWQGLLDAFAHAAAA